MALTFTVFFAFFSFGVMLNSVNGDQYQDFFSQKWCNCVGYYSHDFAKCQDYLRTEFSQIPRVNEFAEKFIKDESMCGIRGDDYIRWPKSIQKHFDLVERFGVYMIVPKLSFFELLVPTSGEKTLTTTTTEDPQNADYPLVRLSRKNIV